MNNEPNFMYGDIKTVDVVATQEILCNETGPDSVERYFNDYAWFVDAVTSPCSCQSLAFTARFDDLNLEQQRVDFVPRLMTGSIGICSEGGELLDIVKKVVFHEHAFDEATEAKMVKELGDVMWYVQQVCLALNVSLQEVIEGNKTKLQARYKDMKFSAEESINRKG